MLNLEFTFEYEILPKIVYKKLFVYSIIVKVNMFWSKKQHHI